MRLRLFLVLAGAALLVRPGWAGEGAVALQTAATSCRTTKTSPPRYVDCGNGTVTDNLTGLVWLKNANCIGVATWSDAMALVAGLADLPDNSQSCSGLTADQCDCNLNDGSSPGEWRLPSIAEWEAVIEHANQLGCRPAITNDLGDDCWSQQCVDAGACSFYHVGFVYWSSSRYQLSAAESKESWYVSLNNGEIGHYYWSGTALVWPVRGGQ